MNFVNDTAIPIILKKIHSDKNLEEKNRTNTKKKLNPHIICDIHNVNRV